MLIDKGIDYLIYYFNFQITVEEWEKKQQLPLYLSKGFKFKKVRIENYNFIFLDCNQIEVGFSSFLLYIEKVHSYDSTARLIVVLSNNVSDYFKDKLIKNEINFIIPGKMIYVPFLGIVYSEKLQSRFLTKIRNKSSYMKPTTQALFLQLVASNDLSRTAKDFSILLNVSIMSISRAFEDLKNFDLFTDSDNYYVREYKLRYLGAELWQMGKKYLTNPIKKRIFVKEDSLDNQLVKELIVSGESALAMSSMLNPPSQKVYGITSKRFKKYEGSLEIIPFAESDSIMIEVWRHELPYNNKVLHPLGIAAVLMGDQDERIEQQVDLMINEYFRKESKWEGILHQNS